ncbi:c-type cytochrome [Luteolibacter arcticus]|uniref:C-type cytochrome n=1 Tax=Luteolibacter arcticus TaxID=1581411 RepID=A0ABT3GCP0_9BACT|nr:MbnP family protein [Luteolibacter arcticus]MCW1921382.1 c-type cytochrome [Luteolibacter arcticus]
MIARLSALLLVLAPLLNAGQRLDVELRPTFGTLPLAFDTLALETMAGQRISLTRCDLLLSKAELQTAAGDWLSAETWSAFVNLREGRTRFGLGDIPAGKYTGLRFHIGVPPETNKGDPAVHPAGHPLNPTVNGMHWGWQGGYIFAAVEGLWRGKEGEIGGYSFHIANDGNLMTVELPLEVDLQRDHTLHLGFDASEIFAGVTIAEEASTTHSRPGDPLAATLKANLPKAFRIESLQPTPTRAEAAAKNNALIAPGATPYRFRFSSTFPHPALPADNPLTEEGVMLGERLFHDTRLSGNGTQSCATCHERRDFFSDRRTFSIGAFGDSGTRQSMPLFNLAWKSSFFWDGRSPSLRAQSLEPIQNPIEMHATLPDVVKKVGQGRHYPHMFDAAFGTPEVNADRLGRALEQFLLTLVSDDSKFDRAIRGQAQLTSEEKRGAELFNTEFDPARGQRGADCFHCHGGPMFQSAAFANNGLSFTDDLGRQAATKLDGDLGKFAVPSLRNVARTAPYMHDGRFTKLEDVIDHYDHGLHRSPTLDPNLAKHPTEGLKLSEADKAALVAFLKTLTDHEFVRPGPPPIPR